MKTLTLTQEQAVNLSGAVIIFAMTSKPEEHQMLYEVGQKLSASDDDVHDITVTLTDEEAALFARITQANPSLAPLHAQLVDADSADNPAPEGFLTLQLTAGEKRALGAAVYAYYMIYASQKEQETILRFVGRVAEDEAAAVIPDEYDIRVAYDEVPVITDCLNKMVKVAIPTLSAVGILPEGTVENAAGLTRKLLDAVNAAKVAA